MFNKKIIILILTCLGITFFILALKTESVKIQPINTPAKVVEQKNDFTKVEEKVVKTKSIILPTPTPSPSQLIDTQTPISPSPTSVSQKTEVTVSINDDSRFKVEISEGLNQCDVLNNALQGGKINSLNMKYSDTFKTFGVYQINGVGKDDQVLWTYSINGKSPPLGCSLVKVNSGDNIVWTYTGPN